MKIKRTPLNISTTNLVPIVFLLGILGRTGKLASKTLIKLGMNPCFLVKNWEGNLLSTGKELGRKLRVNYYFIPTFVPIHSQFYL